MSGPRSFDDDRWPDEENFACCFLCGRKVDPRDKNRGSYTMNNRACSPLPLHLTCLNDLPIETIQIRFMEALNQMSDANAKKALRNANIATVEALGC